MSPSRPQAVPAADRRGIETRTELAPLDWQYLYELGESLGLTVGELVAELVHRNLPHDIAERLERIRASRWHPVWRHGTTSGHKHGCRKEEDCPMQPLGQITCAEARREANRRSRARQRAA